MNPELQRLRAEIRSDLKAFDSQLTELTLLDLDSGSAGDVARAAVALHHAYGAVESLLTRVARHFEGSPPTGPDFHQSLLESMTLELEGIRPAVLRPETARHLRALLAFRHFFRHAYAANLDPVRLGIVRDDASFARPLLHEDVDVLDRLLADVSRRL